MRFYPSVIKYVQRVNEDDPEEIKEFMDGFGIAHEGEIVDGEYGNWDGDSPPRDESHPIAHLTVRKGVVERVILYGHGLTKVPESLQRFPCLLSLNLSNNKIDRIPKWMENIFYLRRLNLSSNCISEIPHWVLNYRWLEDLYLHHNEITELPPGMQFMCMLDVLNVSYNQLKEIPIDQKGKSPSLSLTLHEFHVPFDMAKKSLEKTFWEEESPVEHYYYNVKMDELFRSCHYVRRWNYFYKRKFIRHLWARGNHISEIPKRGSSMKTINFLDNPIRDIPEIYKSRDCKLKFKATVRGIDYEIEKSEYRDFIQWYFNWKPERILKKIEAGEGENLHKECRHPHIHKYLFWIANKVSSVDTSAKRKFDRFIQEYIANFQRRWQTEIVP